MEAHPHELPTLNAPFRLALEAAPTGMLLTDSKGCIAFANQHIERVFGYRRDELIGMPLIRLIPEGSLTHENQYREDLATRAQMGATDTVHDLYGLRKDGSAVPIEVGLNPLDTAEGTFVLSSVVDITDRRRSVQELQERGRELMANLKERDVLLQEIHHRVKNNLQVISSLINMQARKLPEGIVREVLRECKSRIEAIALIHEKLYQSRDYSRVPFSDYLRSLAESVVNAADIKGISLDVQAEEIQLAVDQAIPCGLIFNELITNALKHAFAGRASGSIVVRFKRADDRMLVLSVIDNGIGMAPTPSAHTARTLGLQLIATLTDQLGGHFDIKTEDGTSVVVTFPAVRR
jgi:PAS domain S-box-containing protein